MAGRVPTRNADMHRAAPAEGDLEAAGVAPRPATNVATAGGGAESARSREEAAPDDGHAGHAPEAAARAMADLEALMAQVREANARLIVASVNAQAMTEHAERASHLKDEFLAIVSHELRTPLNAILGWAQMLAANQLAPDRAAHACVSIVRNATALARMIDDLLDVSRIVAGTLRLSPRLVDLAAVAREAVDAVRPLAEAKNLRLALTVDDTTTARIRGDAGRLLQAVQNVVVNAIKFTPEGGRVDVIVEASTDHVVVRVADTGEGISPELIPHIFERFRQGDSPTTRRHGGLGLGLAIVRQLIELHGGTVEAFSGGVGCGSTFTIRLPMAPSGDGPADGLDAPTADGSARA